ncbi:Pectin lyase-like superfamily protein [Quillaja saponaria]|uniref:Pectin lyase-like superfamily protein n=1 Tax=Quillaja saponaria TaxID=32244 RepID=A0AAD7LSW7_QUISA|nr:Pectin lyase-like superfamily protein [Quillaja saponaria]
MEFTVQDSHESTSMIPFLCFPFCPNSFQTKQGILVHFFHRYIFSFSKKFSTKITNPPIPIISSKIPLMGILILQVTKVISVLFLVALLSIRGAESRKSRKPKPETLTYSFEYTAINCRAHSASLTDYGGVGDGTTSNTKAFKTAISNLSQYASNGGAQLYVPAGKWLTGSFSLISHFTLFLHKDAVLLASQDMTEWPVIKPLPSYGRGRDAAAGRYTSLIFGTNLTDVTITGENGTIDGQGAFWWQNFHRGKLKYTRPYLIEIMFSENVQISSLTLLNSPNWNIHPVYSSNIVVQGITIIAPITSPNTDGINPDSCTNTKIEDCYIVSGDDCVAVKSGWDEYGIAFGWPTKHLIVRRLTCISPYSAVIALGSEMSGGIQDVRAEDITAIQYRIWGPDQNSHRKRRICERHICERNDNAYHEMGL